MRRVRGIWLGLLALALVAGLLFAMMAGGDDAEGVGIADVLVPDPADKALEARVWYPLTPAGRHARDRDGRLPLIVISHGTGGSMTGHRDTAVALARAGYIVVAVNHSGDNYRDQSYVGEGRHLIGRPRHIARAIDYMLTRWTGAVRVDPARIGLFGHSAGGFTGLVVAGGHPDIRLARGHCQHSPGAWDCRYLKGHGLDIGAAASARPTIWQGDPRVKAIAIAAPAVGYSFVPHGLDGVKIPVQLWQANRDDIVDDSPSIIRRLLPAAPEFHAVANAGHFVFLAPCDWRMKAAVRVMHLTGVPDICTDPPGFDREAFHAAFNHDLVAFFDSHLPI